MKNEILKIIEELCQERKDAKAFPYIVTDVELQKVVKKKVVDIIRELWKEEKVDVGRTANHNFVEIRTPDSPRRNRKIILHEIL